MKKSFLKFTAFGILAILLISLIFTGCGAGPRFDQPAITSLTVELDQDRVTGPDDTSPATVITLTPGATIPPVGSPTPRATTGTGISIRISIQVANFDIVDEIGDTDGDGYIIYYLDQIPEVIRSEIPGILPGTPATPGAGGQNQQPQLQQDGRRITTTATNFVWDNVASGLRILSAQLVDTQGNPLSPPAVVAAVAFVPQLQLVD